MIKSAISRLFLSIISMWVLPLWPASGSSRNLAAPPVDLMALTVAAQPSRRSSPFGPGAPLLLSPHTDSSGTLEKIFTTSSAVTGAQLPSILTNPSILTAGAHGAHGVGAGLRVHHDDRGTDLAEERAERLHGVGAGAGQRRLRIGYELRGVLVERLDRKLRAGEGRRIGRADAEEVPGALARRDLDVGQQSGIGFGTRAVDRRRVEARAPAPGMIDDVNREALASEIGRPALAPVRGGLIGSAGVAGAVHHDDRRSADGLRDAVLHVHLVDGDRAGLRDAADGGPGGRRLGEWAVDEEAPFVLQPQRPAGRSRHCASSRRQQHGCRCRAPMSVD